MSDLYQRLHQIRPADVPVMTVDRSIPRKQQAALTRKLFKDLGLKGVSVTTPNHANASSVYIRLPRFGPSLNSPTNANAKLRIEAILDVAFPNHNDRSERLTDYFDFCWVVNFKNDVDDPEPAKEGKKN